MAFDPQAIAEEFHEKYPNEKEFLQVVDSFLNKVSPFIRANPNYQDKGVIMRMLEPDQIISFRVSWVDSAGKERLNRGYRVQFNRALGPYKGGLRFHPSVNISILKFLGFEQSLKNSLTGLQLGAGKGGADFDPGRNSDLDVMRFCQAFAAEFFHIANAEADVPAGDIGVSEREIGYIFGYTNKLKRRFSGSFTGKSLESGGSCLRPQATGYGCLYFLEQMLKDNQLKPEEMTANISGAGNVAIYACEKALELGIRVQTLSDSKGVIYDEEGMNEEKLAFVKKVKFEERGRIEEVADKFGLEYSADKNPWDFPCTVALPCATQNELDESDAQKLIDNGCKAVAEGANMPCTNGAVDLFLENGLLYAPGKASNAGGVSVSAFEMAQNKMGLRWTAEEVDTKLKHTMKHIYSQCLEYGGKVNGVPNYVSGANAAGFARLYRAMKNQGVF